MEVPAYTALQADGRLADRMLELMLNGVSTRKYETVLPALADQAGISKSEVSRETIEAGTRVLRELAERDLSELDVLVVYVDGIQFAQYHVLAAVGVDASGRKHVLGLCGGASENTTVTTSSTRRTPGGRRQTNRVTRWRNEEMAVRWAAVTFRETEKHYRRLTGYEHLWMLKAHLHDKDGARAELQKAG